MNHQRLIIIGFMASGKTTLVHQLARQLSCSAIDLDELIARRERRTPQEIIEQDGEAEFRRIETEALREVLSDASVKVLALGGGAWTVVENRKLIAEQEALTVWLDAPFELCWKRIEAGQATRPLAPSEQSARKLYSERRSIYESGSVCVSVSEYENAEDIATKITEIVRLQGAKG
jgi:shikimate kinase